MSASEEADLVAVSHALKPNAQDEQDDASLFLELTCGAGIVTGLKVHRVEEDHEVRDLLGNGFLTGVAVLSPSDIPVGIRVLHGQLQELQVGHAAVAVLRAHEDGLAPLDHGLHIRGQVDSILRDRRNGDAALLLAVGVGLEGDGLERNDWPCGRGSRTRRHLGRSDHLKVADATRRTQSLRGIRHTSWGGWVTSSRGARLLKEVLAQGDL